jgi:hypothetical protein
MPDTRQEVLETIAADIGNVDNYDENVQGHN